MVTEALNTLDTELKVEKKSPKKNFKYLRDQDRQLVKGIFRFYEAPGSSLKFCFKKWKEDPIEQFDLQDGQVYSLPLGVAKHLNKSGSYPEYGYVQGDPNIVGGFGPTGQVMQIVRKVRRYGFQSLEFVDVDDIGESSEIVDNIRVI